MYKKLLPMLLVSVMVFSITGCSNRSPVSKNPAKETTTALETTTTIEDNIIADDNTSNKEDNTSNDKTTEYDETVIDETTSNEDAASDNESEPVTEPSGEGMTEPVTEPATKPSTEGTTSKPTTAPSTVAPTSKPTQAPTSAPTEAPTQKPTSAPTEEPTQAPTEAPTEDDKSVYVKTIDGVPYTVDTVQGKAYVEEFCCIGLTFPDEVHLQYKVDGYKVEYRDGSLVGIVTKTLHIDKNISELLNFDSVEGVETYYWPNENLERFSAYCFSDNTTIYLGTPSTQLTIYSWSGDWDENGNSIFRKYSLNELYNEYFDIKREGTETKIFVCPDGTFDFSNQTLH